MPTPLRITPHQTPKAERRPAWRAILRGLRRRCPRCGRGPYRTGYLTIIEACPVCGEQLGHIRADDGPAYFTVLIVGHIAVPATLWVEQTWAPPLAPFMAAGLVATAMLTWALLPSVKGAVLGLMWALGLRGDEHHGDQHG